MEANESSTGGRASGGGENKSADTFFQFQSSQQNMSWSSAVAFLTDGGWAVSDAGEPWHFRFQLRTLSSDAGVVAARLKYSRFDRILKEETKSGLERLLSVHLSCIEAMARHSQVKSRPWGFMPNYSYQLLCFKFEVTGNMLEMLHVTSHMSLLNTTYRIYLTVDRGNVFEWY